jgi:PAS domain S-box-containing protein
MGKTEKVHSTKRHLTDLLPAVTFEYVFFKDGRRDFTYISPRCQKMFGLTTAEIMCGVLPMQDFIHPDDWPSFERNILHKSRTIQVQREWKWKGRVKSTNGFIWVEATATGELLDNGNVSWAGIIQDITEQKKLEEIQRQSEQRYEDLVENLPLGILILVDQNVHYINECGSRLLGAEKPEDMIGRNYFDFIHPDKKLKSLERAAAILSGKRVSAIEQKLIRLDGREVDVEASAIPFAYNGSPGIQVILKDLTDQKITLSAFKKSESLFSQLFSVSPMAIVMLDKDGYVKEVNEGFERMFGYCTKELAGKSLNQFIVPNELTAEGNDLNTLISSQRVIRIETKRIHKNGNVLSVIIYGLPITVDNEAIGIFGLYVDFTEQKKIEEELKIRNIELDNFVYKVSHDLRAPLSSVRGLVNLAGLPDNNDNLKDYLTIIGSKVEQLDHFITDVLSHSKNLKLEIKVEAIDLHPLIDHTFTELSYLNGADQIKRTVTINGTEFYSDRWRLGEIFRNLISNAIKYRNFKRSNSEIIIDIDITPEKAIVSFKDNGIGISTENLEKIFNMFYRASEQSDGSGLGLYIVKNAIDKLNGTIEVASKEFEFTHFTIQLPNLISKK